MANASKSFNRREFNAKSNKDDISIYYGELKLKFYEVDGVRWCKKVPVEGSGFYIRKIKLHPLCYRTTSPSEVANNYGGKVLLPGALLPKAFTKKKAPRVKFKKMKIKILKKKTLVKRILKKKHQKLSLTNLVLVLTELVNAFIRTIKIPLILNK